MVKQLSLLYLLCLSLDENEAFQPFSLVSKQPQFTVKIRTTVTKLELSGKANENRSGKDNNATTYSKKPRKKKIVINSNFAEVKPEFSEQKEQQQNNAKETVKSNLGVPSRKKKSSASKNENKILSKKAQKIARQRTANGTINGNLQTGIALPEDQKIQIQSVKRGSKQLTIIRGFTCPMDERKEILKGLKKKVGGGGTMVEGIIEIQGSHSEVVMKNLLEEGFVQVKIIK